MMHYYRWPVTPLRHNKAVLFDDGSISVEKHLIGDQRDIELFSLSITGFCTAKMIRHPKDCPELLVAILRAKSMGLYREDDYEPTRNRTETNSLT